MEDFSQARENMVDCQINPMGVVSEPILEAFGTLPREQFLPDNLKCKAYCDEDVALGQGRYLIEPWVHAKLIEAMRPDAGDVALDIGGATGYSAAVLSSLVSTVVAVEATDDLINQAEANWQALSICNVVSFKGALTEGCAPHGPYDLIFFNGSVAAVPDSIKSQLADGGRLVAVITKGDCKVGQATMIEHEGQGVYSERVLFDAGIPCLDGFGQGSPFVF